MPAFSQGLKRNASDPLGLMRFLNALSSGRHTGYFDDPRQAFAPSGNEEGNAILGHLFGSKELSRAVAAQAAQATGISQAVLKSMLPALAPMILGGLYRQLAESSTQGAGGRRQADDNPLGKMFEQMTGGGGRQAEPGEAADENPLGRIFEEMLGGGRTRPGAGGGESAGSRAERDEQPPREHPGERSGGLEDLFGELFDAGRCMQKEYQKNVESIFDQFLAGMRKHGR